MLSNASPRSLDRDSGVARGSRRHFLLALLALFMVNAAWAVAVPIDGSPDEHRHLIYGYALATGQVDGKATVYSAPRYLAENRSLCYRDRPYNSAACDRLSLDPANAAEVQVPTTANHYPPLYYRLAGWPLGLLDGESGVYAARLVGALIGSALLALALTVAWSSGSRWLTLGSLMAITPMTGFLIGSFNPHGMELAASLAFIVGLLAVLHRQGGGQMARVTVLIAVLPMTWVRPGGFIWPVLLTGLITLSAPDRWRSWTVEPRWFRWAFALLAVAASGLALGWQWLRGSREIGAPNPGANLPGLDSFWHTLAHSMLKLQISPGDWVGVFGWLDTRATSATLLVWFTLVGGLVMFGLALGHRHDLMWAGAAIVTAAAVSVAMDLYYHRTEGVLVAQARYMLPLVMLALCLLALNLRGAGAVTARLPAIVVTLWIVGSLLAFGEALRRYSMGNWLLSGTGIWYPPINSFLLVFLAGGGLLIVGLISGRLARETEWRITAGVSVLILTVAVVSSPIAVGG